MIIPIASDHAGYQAKEIVKQLIEKKGFMAVDFGTHSEDSVDYPDFAIKVAELVDEGDYKQGILICGTGQGMCMTANKYPNLRAALVYNENSANMARRHNNANLLCIPGRELDEDQLTTILDTWFNSEFEGGRHERRVNKISSLTNNKSSKSDQ